MKRDAITPQFVEFVPRELAEGVLYISKEYGSASHLCLCGCGRKVVTPLSATGWRLTENDGRVSLWPSVGNWNFPCQSHYVIRDSRVIWAGKWSKARIEAGFAADVARKERFYAERERSQEPELPPKISSDTIWNRFVRWWKSLLR